MNLKNPRLSGFRVVFALSGVGEEFIKGLPMWFLPQLLLYPTPTDNFTGGVFVADLAAHPKNARAARSDLRPPDSGTMSASVADLSSCWGEKLWRRSSHRQVLEPLSPGMGSCILRRNLYRHGTPLGAYPANRQTSP
jgi:hypothetical protein